MWALLKEHHSKKRGPALIEEENKFSTMPINRLSRTAEGLPARQKAKTTRPSSFQIVVRNCSKRDNERETSAEHRELCIYTRSLSATERERDVAAVAKGFRSNGGAGGGGGGPRSSDASASEARAELVGGGVGVRARRRISLVGGGVGVRARRRTSLVGGDGRARGQRRTSLVGGVVGGGGGG
ncbi:hypothetical protein NL676_033199 [Syzygium grande]|nr:hypothetical protein NL676_033199 [Syzygium grande]